MTFNLRDWFRRWGAFGTSGKHRDFEGLSRSAFGILYYIAGDGRIMTLSTCRSAENKSYVTAGIHGRAWPGGMADAGETLVQCMMREIIEEVGGDFSHIDKQVRKGVISAEKAKRVKEDLAPFVQETKTIMDRHRGNVARLIQRSLMRPQRASGWDVTIDSVYKISISEQDANRLIEISALTNDLMTQHGIPREVEKLEAHDLNDICLHVNSTDPSDRMGSEPEALAAIALQHILHPEMRPSLPLLDLDNMPQVLKEMNTESYLGDLQDGHGIIVDPTRGAELWESASAVHNNGIRRRHVIDGKQYLEVVEPDAVSGNFVSLNPRDIYPHPGKLGYAGYYELSTDGAPGIYRKRVPLQGAEPKIKAMILSEDIVIPGIHDSHGFKTFKKGDWLILEKKPAGEISMRAVERAFAIHSYSFIETLGVDREYPRIVRHFSAELLAEEAALFPPGASAIAAPPAHKK